MRVKIKEKDQDDGNTTLLIKNKKETKKEKNHKFEKRKELLFSIMFDLSLLLV